MNLDPEALEREIDETLAELDRLEAEVVELFGELLGPEARRQVADHMRAKERDPRTEPLRRAAAVAQSQEEVRGNATQGSYGAYGGGRPCGGRGGEFRTSHGE